jgi:hypothetical protein
MGMFIQDASIACVLLCPTALYQRQSLITPPSQLSTLAQMHLHIAYPYSSTSQAISSSNSSRSPDSDVYCCTLPSSSSRSHSRTKVPLSQRVDHVSKAANASVHNNQISTYLPFLPCFLFRISCVFLFFFFPPPPLFTARRRCNRVMWMLLRNTTPTPFFG